MDKVCIRFLKKSSIFFLITGVSIICVFFFAGCSKTNSDIQDRLLDSDGYEKAYQDFLDKKREGIVTEKTPELGLMDQLDYSIDLYDVEKFCKSPTAVDIYDNQVVFYDSFLPNRPIFLYDTQTNENTLIHSTPESGLTNHDPKIGDGWVFWTEAPITASIERWKIKAYNIKDNSVRVIKEGGLEANNTLIPRIQNENNKLIWIEGKKNKNDELLHNIFLYDADKDEIEEIKGISYLENPYTVLDIKNNVISYFDLIGDAWNVLLFNPKEDNVFKIPLKEKSIFEIPRKVVSNSNYLAYKTAFSGLYVYTFDSEETVFIDRAKTVAAGADFIAYESNGGLFIYKINENKTYNISEHFGEKNTELSFRRVSIKQEKIVALALDLESGDEYESECIAIIKVN